MHDKENFHALQKWVRAGKIGAAIAALFGLLLTYSGWPAILRRLVGIAFWIVVIVTVLLLALVFLTFHHSPGRNSIAFRPIVKSLFRGDNSSPAVGFISFLALLYGTNLMSALISGGASWQRIVIGVCFMANVVFMAMFAILYEANRNASSRNLKDAIELVYAISCPNFSKDSFSSASVADILSNDFYSEPPVPAASTPNNGSSADKKHLVNINPLFMSIQYHLPALRQVDILISCEVEEDLQQKYGSIDKFKKLLQKKIQEIPRESGATGDINVQMCSCKTGNDVRSFHDSAERQLKKFSIVHKSREVPSKISVALTSGSTTMTTALLLLAIKYDLLAEYMPQGNTAGKVEPQLIPTEMASEIVDPLNRRLSGSPS